MTKKSVVGLALVLTLVLAGTSAMAFGPGYGGGGRGFGPCSWNSDSDESVAMAKLRGEIYGKYAELNQLISQSPVDEGKVKALQGEINKLNNQLADKRIEAQIEFKKKNPDWKPGYGWGDGQGRGQGRGHGPGAGACWR
ncbi:MAG: hypothetical protein KKB20_15255 [Proteobacteria bacterium]|nr:hypothetical protein [Pseudomonadota bacterium]